MKYNLALIMLLGIYCAGSGTAYARDKPKGSGEEVANRITIRYGSIVANCGAANKPAYECSGVVIHGEDNRSTDMPWSPSDDNSMSYSYLRQDIFNPIFASYDYGIILIPQQELSESQYRPRYACTFPINGGSNGREDDGCGEIPSVPISATCQSQGLFNAEDWITAFEADKFISLCGWDLVNEQSAVAFEAMVEGSRYYIEEAGLNVENNEIVLRAWGGELLKNLPIEAIFYAKRGTKKHSDRNLLKAQEAQLNYFSETGMWIPIVHMDEHRDDAPIKYQYSFSYVDEEQIVQPIRLGAKSRNFR
jgi:hypothetical protein